MVSFLPINKGYRYFRNVEHGWLSTGEPTHPHLGTPLVTDQEQHQHRKKLRHD
jgi:hypothetical protein